MEHNELTPELVFVEEIALVFEGMGLFRMAGRVIGWLLICDPPEQTFGQIAEALQASKGSISNAMQFLVSAGWVERFSRPGERRDYFRWRTGQMVDLTRKQARFYGELTTVASRGLDVLREAPANRKQRLLEMHDFFAWLDRQMPALWERWEREKAAGPQQRPDEHDGSSS